ncbi:ESX secretion-associated protein EspG [Nocardia sp. NPDC051030]|uniref:ESX secretion-associated protein EspG n=1 Tax=Nocardia sp. NPDC051030 TaxID=3155162 RepID=UPI00343D2CD6
MHRSWSLTDLELLALWEELGEQFLPDPLKFGRRTELWDEHLAQVRHAREALDRDPALEEALAAVHAADVRVELRGWDDREWQLPEGTIRVLGARRGDLGYLLVQQPGETGVHSGGFTITEFYAEALADELVAVLPEVTAGRGRDIVLADPEHTDDFEYAYDLSPAHETAEGTVVDRAADFLAVPATTAGTIDVVQGHSVFGPRGIVRYRLGYRDVQGDGRYLITNDVPPVATSADRRRVSTAIDTLISEVLIAIDDERV